MNKGLTTILFSLFLLVLNACSKKEVKLPLIDVDTTTEIQNHSSIWVFYGTENGEDQAELNKNNKITTTHWIFNIDRRLNMEALIPVLEQMQEERNRDSMHKKEGMLNYFSYANTLSSNISLCLFKQTWYQRTTPDLDAIKDEEKGYCVFKLTIDDEDWFLDRQRVSADNLLELSEIKDCDSLKPLMLVLHYDGTLKYENYLKAKAVLEYHDIATYENEYVSD